MQVFQFATKFRLLLPNWQPMGTVTINIYANV